MLSLEAQCRGFLFSSPPFLCLSFPNPFPVQCISSEIHNEWPQGAMGMVFPWIDCLALTLHGDLEPIEGGQSWGNNWLPTPVTPLSSFLIVNLQPYCPSPHSTITLHTTPSWSCPRPSIINTSTHLKCTLFSQVGLIFFILLIAFYSNNTLPFQ